MTMTYFIQEDDDDEDGLLEFEKKLTERLHAYSTSSS